MKKSFIRTFSIRIIAAVLLHFLVKLFDRSFHGNMFDFGYRGIVFLLFCIGFVLIIWYLADLIYRFSLKYIPSEHRFIKHISVLIIEYLLFGIFVSIAFISLYALLDFSIFHFWHYERVGQLIDFDANIGIYLAYCFVLAFNTQFYLLNHWKKIELQNQQLKEENIRSRFEVLKSQIEPHFFFNSLSVLSQLVYNDADQAAKYIDRLSKLYRHILIQKNDTLVSISQELQILDAYIFLITVRFGTSISFTITLDDTICRDGFIPHNTLQILAENTIKHNKLSIEHPLHVFINTENGYLMFKNDRQPRLHIEPGNGIGLENIKNRYSLISDKKVMIENNGIFFTVYIPILNSVDNERTRV